ncbi:MAG: 50S ribosomal protein L24 [Dehalococcoidia bacterium]|nr:50S ribosomal protein L24 [Dehalococcoidia bacterium]
MRRIKRDDTVRVLTGRDRGKQGQVRQIIAERDRVVVQGISMIKRHMKASGMNQPAAIVEREAAIHMSNVRLICPQCNNPTGVGFRTQANGARVRYCKRCDQDID